MQILDWGYKYVDEVDYWGVDWTRDLGEATISSATITVSGSTGLVAGSAVIDDAITKFELTGGTASKNCRFHVLAVLSDGREISANTKLLVLAI